MTTIRDNAKVLINRFLGWNTNRKIVVIESDDWGSIRMPSKGVYDKLLSKGIRVDNSTYCKYDSLESEDDLTALFEVLESVKDSVGNPAKLTANCIMANPDFAMIKKNGFTKYYYEPVTKTFENYPQCKNSFNLWLEGFDKGVFIPQFHGREHVNAPLWLEALQKNNEQVKLGFDNNFFGFDWPGITESRFGFMAPLEAHSENTDSYEEEFFQEGLTLFESYFGFRSQTFIAPCYTWNTAHEKLAMENGITQFQGIPFQLIPSESSRPQKGFHYTGQKTKGLLYTIRNCFFEPTLTGQSNSVDDCLKRIELAFKSKKPAIIGSHRLNYIGSINAENRDINLKLLKELLTKIVRTWPNVEFHSASSLAALMQNR